VYLRTDLSLLNLLLSLSDALDLASPELSQHQMRVAFASWEIARESGLDTDTLDTLFIAALLHDVGALAPEEKIAIQRSTLQYYDDHCVLGERLLRQVRILAPGSAIVRLHHRPARKWQEVEQTPVALASQILLLADILERSIDRSRFILHQQEEIVARISSLSGQTIAPEAVAHFLPVAAREDFWLDLVSPRLYSILIRSAPLRGRTIGLVDLKPVSAMFRDMIDFRSPFTATHSSGVATSAAALARLYGFTEFEVELMEVAGNLHDLGKLGIPTRILEKPGKLDAEEFAIIRQHTYHTYTVLVSVEGLQGIAEWGAFHHERLDGSGYPFHLDASSLNAGARIMTVADMFTALAEDRPYRPGMCKDELLGIIKNAERRGFLDKRVVAVLEAHYEEVHSLAMRAQTEALEHFEREFAVRPSEDEEETRAAA
jgi:HD-GYP domain-containing protein (c-di-GMP phosphodiesterase class II)